METTRGGKRQGTPLEVARGESALFSMSVDPNGGWYEVRIAPTFVPARTGHGDDHRELSAMLGRCGIVGADGERIELFPEQAAA